MKNEKFGEILKTTEYEKFKFVKTNRKINQKNIKKLRVSMKEEQLIIPICVNKAYEIIDGQHRFTVSKELGLPIYYYIVDDYNTSQMKRANLVSGVWTRDDFLNMYIQDELEDYTYFYGLMNQYNISSAVTMLICSKVLGTTPSTLQQVFERGEMVIQHSDRMEITRFTLALIDFRDVLPEFKTTSFVRAFIELYFQPDYSHKHMMEKVEIRKSFIEHKPTKGDYMEMLANNVYSYGSRKNLIYYDKIRCKFYRPENLI